MGRKGASYLKDVHSNTVDKQAESQKRSKVYNTEKINKMILDLAHAGSPDLDPFWHGLPQYRDAGVIFEYTEWELLELEKCANDPIYFIENYCTFKNDKGRTTVKLRDYQKDTIHLYGDEVWDPVSETAIPKNRRVILMWSRQCAKCITMDTSIKTNFKVDLSKYGIHEYDNSNELKMYEIYFSNIKNPTKLDILLFYCYKLNDGPLKGKLDKLIYKLEIKKYGTEFKQKIVESQLCHTIIESCNCKNNTMYFHRTIPFQVYELELENGNTLKCADMHLVYSNQNFIDQWKNVKDLTTNDYVLTNLGYSKVKSIKATKNVLFMCDFSIAEEEHSYFTNNILSHNTTTTAAYFAHFLTFNNDRSALVVANKGRTGLEIMGKIKEVLEDLPFFMKPGIVNLLAGKMKFENGCSLQTAAASKSPATGDSLNLLYIDECALIPNNIIKEYWASVYPTLSSFRGSQIIISSTPRGKGNLFYEFYNGAVMGTKKGWKYKRVDWWQVPEHDDEWLAQLKQDLGEDLFKREVELSFESAGDRLISNHTIKYFNKIKKEFKPVEFFSVPLEISKNIIWDPDFHPDLLTYYDLMNRRFLLSIDTAQGIEAGAVGKEDADYNVINIFEILLMCPGTIERNRDNKPINVKDVVRYKLVGLYIDNFKDEAACAEAAKFITFHILKSGFKKIDNTRILIEMNFNGNNWLTKFKDHPSYYDGVIVKTQHGTPLPGQKPKFQYGYKTTTGIHGKNYYCEIGAAMMHKGLICIRLYNDENVNISSQGLLYQFSKDEKGKYCGSCCHDDISVTSLFVCVAQESTQFRSWLNEWIETCRQTRRVLIIRNMLQIYVEKEVLMSDDDFKRFYNTAGQNFGKITHLQNGYGSLMNSYRNTNSNSNIYGNNRYIGNTILNNRLMNYRFR